jgi:hypothetical protein
MERLLKVAARDDLLFTAAEFDHLNRCSDCFRCWSEFIGSLQLDERAPKAKAKKQKNGG